MRCYRGVAHGKVDDTLGALRARRYDDILPAPQSRSARSAAGIKHRMSYRRGSTRGTARAARRMHQPHTGQAGVDLARGAAEQREQGPLGARGVARAVELEHQGLGRAFRLDQADERLVMVARDKLDHHDPRGALGLAARRHPEVGPEGLRRRRQHQVPVRLARSSASGG